MTEIETDELVAGREEFGSEFGFGAGALGESGHTGLGSFALAGVGDTILTADG